MATHWLTPLSRICFLSVARMLGPSDSENNDKNLLVGSVGGFCFLLSQQILSILTVTEMTELSTLLLNVAISIYDDRLCLPFRLLEANLRDLRQKTVCIQTW
jgi:hypothetical protein